MATLCFKAKMEIIGVNPYVLVSAQQAQELKKDWKKPMPVLVQVNGQPDEPWHINMMPVGDGSFYLYLHGDVRKASGTGVGDVVEVEVSFDSGYRNGPMHPMPEWFEKPLYANPKARRAWDSLTPSRQKEILRYLTALKSDEARQRNLTRALDALSVDDIRFMGRTWKQGK
ncbi:MAG TPA: YdeI/OmpD-associated family protein [Candidatus Saccharimonadia bacterium]|nr:YdeI/OmpD-associated family protein [Candidatus Saccharimonadia bacterium]